jgi:FAD/FMN-containing dehydrogenase
VKGIILRPGDEEYDASRKIFNAMIDRHPVIIVRSVGVADVVNSVNFASQNGLPLSIKGGGHNVSGSAICDDGLVIDFSSMKSIRVDPKRKVARVEPGVTWGEFDHQCSSSDSPLPGGSIRRRGSRASPWVGE